MRPARGKSFRLESRSLDLRSGAATFDYELDGEAFSERFVLPLAESMTAGSELDRLLDICHIAVGTSYFKLHAPEQIVFGRAISGDLADLTRHLYDDGLREFAVTNGLAVPLQTELVGIGGSAAAASSATPRPPIRPLVPVGGGKDSAAVLSMLRGADAVVISPTTAQRRLATAAKARLHEVERTIDERLFSRTEQAGALNGHIPITAINSAISVLLAYLLGYDAVVMANERSANEPTRMIDGTPVNHQYSKSFAFEQLFQAAVAPSGVAYFSLLRRLSELSIAGIVVQEPSLRTAFLSCNRAFTRKSGDREQRWCLKCPKCLFTFLCFAPFLVPSEAVELFGGNPLEELELVSAFRDLWSDDTKPFDCVGERFESAIAMDCLARVAEWQHLPVVQAVTSEVHKKLQTATLSVEDILEPQGPHAMPDELARLADDRARSVQLRR